MLKSIASGLKSACSGPREKLLGRGQLSSGDVRELELVAKVMQSTKPADDSYRRLLDTLESSMHAFIAAYRLSKGATVSTEALANCRRHALKYAADNSFDELFRMVKEEVNETAVTDVVDDLEKFSKAYRNINLLSADTVSDQRQALQEFTRISASFARLLLDAGKYEQADLASRLPRHAVSLFRQ